MTKGIVFCAVSLALLLAAGAVSAAPAETSARCHLGWRVVPSPRVSDAGLGAVDAISRADVWVARGLTSTGASGPVLYERWNGRRWHVRRLAVKASGDPLSLSASSSRDVWILGNTPDFRPLTLHYDGRGWTSLPVPAAPNEFDILYDVVALAPNNAWAVGQSVTRGTVEQNALILHWDGSRWSRVEAPAGLENLYALAAVSPNDIWAVAPAQEDPAVGLRVIVVHWDGTIWREVESGLRSVDLGFARAVSANNIWAVGSTSGTAKRGVVVHWNGRDFRIVRTTGRSGTDVFFAVAAAGRQAWAAGDEDIVHWDGRGWHRTHFKGVDFFGADALSTRDVWAAGGNRRRPLIYHYACR